MLFIIFIFIYYSNQIVIYTYTYEFINCLKNIFTDVLVILFQCCDLCIPIVYIYVILHIVGMYIRS